FTELEFTKLLQDLNADAPKAVSISYDKYRLITTDEGLRGLIAELKAAPTISVDLETTSIDPMRARIVGFSLCGKEGEPAYIPVGHNYLGVPTQLRITPTLSALKPVLEDSTIRKVAQNATY